MFSAGMGVVFGLVGLLMGAAPVIAGCLLFVGLFGFPRWLLGYLSKRRQKAFLEELPNAVDVIVRGVKSGLPINDCMNIIATESKEPVRTEFVRIMETQQLGVPLFEAVGRLFERMPLRRQIFSRSSYRSNSNPVVLCRKPSVISPRFYATARRCEERLFQ